MSQGLALQLQMQLAELRRKHGTPPPAALPPVPPSPRALPTSAMPCIIHGVAAATTTDATRIRFAKNCFQWDVLPTILYRHINGREVGKCLSLRHDSQGRLIISAEITCPIAAACHGLSIGATVLKYEIVNAASWNYFALVHAARADEVSTTPVPCNVDCRITSRWPPSAQAKQYDILKRGVDVIGRIAQVAATEVAKAQRQKTRVAPPPSRVLSPPTRDFARLVNKITTRGMHS